MPQLIFSAENPPKLCRKRFRPPESPTTILRNVSVPLTLSHVNVNVKQEQDDKFNEKEDDSEYVRTSGPVTEFMEYDDELDSTVGGSSVQIEDSDCGSLVSVDLDPSGLSLEEIIQRKKQHRTGKFGLDKVITLMKEHENMSLDEIIQLEEQQGNLSLEQVSQFKQQYGLENLDCSNMSLAEIIQLKKPQNGFANSDYSNMSLDEVIRVKEKRGLLPMARAHRKARNVAGQRVKGPSRHIVRITQLEQAPSPISILQKMENVQETVEMHSAELVGPDKTMDQSDRKVRWRVEWHYKDLIGYGVGPRKVLASQIAALDLFKKMREQGLNPEFWSPEPAIPKGCLITPFIYSLLDQKAKELGIQLPEFTCHFSKDNQRNKFFIACCVLDGTVYEGVSYEETYAKRLAAKNAFDSLYGREFRLDEIVDGESVPEIHDGYVSSHSNVHHVYHLEPLEAKRARMDDSEAGAETIFVIPAPPKPSRITVTKEFFRNPLFHDTLTEDSNELYDINSVDMYGELSDSEDEWEKEETVDGVGK